MWDLVNRAGSELGASILAISIPVAAYLFGAWIAKKSRKDWVGWASGFALLATGYILLLPSIELLRAR